MRHGRRSGSAGDWMSQFSGPMWPVVRKAALTSYRSRLAKRNPDQPGPPQPEHIRRILSVLPVPVLDWLRETAPFSGAEPSLSGPLPAAPVDPGPSPPAPVEPRWSDYEPAQVANGLVGKLKDVLSGAAGARETAARSRFNRDTETWKRERHQRERVHRSHQDRLTSYRQESTTHARNEASLEEELRREKERVAAFRQDYERERVADESVARRLLAEADGGKTGAVESLARQLLDTLPLPIALPDGSSVAFDAEQGILLYELYVPNLEEAGLVVRLKTRDRPATEKEVRTAQEFTVHALPLRVMHEVFATPEFHAIRLVGTNLRLRYVDRSTGKRMDEVVGSLAATRTEMASLDVAQVEPRQCFRALKGVSSPSFQDLSPVRPILSFDRDDRRIVEAREVADHLAPEQNLAAMDWEDFEHIVRELFAKMFSARSTTAEVHVTRASRDYGVDALVHDPDPIHGGKFVIQAKRYVNTVDVAAVRDLFGTVQNEGANRGYLVTTSSFGPDAYAFAKGKPLSLIDGSHLLQLLQEQGYTFRINLAEAKQELQARR